jgi:two-component system response regulator HydG
MQNGSQPFAEAVPVFDGKENSLSLEAVEKAAVLRMLEAANGNKSQAARRLGITRKTLHKKLKKYGVMD